MHLPHFEDAEGLVGFKLCDCIRPPRAVHQPPGLRPAKNGDEAVAKLRKERVAKPVNPG